MPQRFHKRRFPLALIATALACTLLLAGCGYKGPLSPPPPVPSVPQ